jgi:toxin YoeB
MAKRLVWSARAQADFFAILIFWDENNQNDYYSKKLGRRIHELLFLISENNFLGKPTATENVRITVCDSYLIIYEIHGNDIIILTIFDGRRNPKHLKIK